MQDPPQVGGRAAATDAVLLMEALLCQPALPAAGSAADPKAGKQPAGSGSNAPRPQSQVWQMFGLLVHTVHRI